MEWSPNASPIKIPDIPRPVSSISTRPQSLNIPSFENVRAEPRSVSLNVPTVESLRSTSRREPGSLSPRSVSLNVPTVESLRREAAIRGESSGLVRPSLRSQEETSIQRSPDYGQLSSVERAFPTVEITSIRCELPERRTGVRPASPRRASPEFDVPRVPQILSSDRDIVSRPRSPRRTSPERDIPRFSRRDSPEFDVPRFSPRDFPERDIISRPRSPRRISPERDIASRPRSPRRISPERDIPRFSRRDFSERDIPRSPHRISPERDIVSRPRSPRLSSRELDFPRSRFSERGSLRYPEMDLPSERLTRL